MWVPKSILLKGSNLIVAGYIPSSEAERATTDNWPAFTLDITRELAPYIEAHHDCIVLGPGENCIGDVFEVNHPGLRYFVDRFEIETEAGVIVTYPIALKHWVEVLEETA